MGANIVPTTSRIFQFSSRSRSTSRRLHWPWKQEYVLPKDTTACTRFFISHSFVPFETGDNRTGSAVIILLSSLWITVQWSLLCLPVSSIFLPILYAFMLKRILESDFLSQRFIQVKAGENRETQVPYLGAYSRNCVNHASRHVLTRVHFTQFLLQKYTHLSIYNIGAIC